MEYKDRSRFNDIGSSNGLRFKEHYFDCSNHPVMVDPVKPSTQSSTVLSLNEDRMFNGLLNSLRVSPNDVWRIVLLEAATSGSKGLQPHVTTASTSTTKRGYQKRETKHKLYLTTSEKQQLKSLAKDLGLTAKETLRAALHWLSQGIKKDKIKELIDGPKLDAKETRKVIDAKLKAKGPDYVKKDISNLINAHKEAYEEGAKRNLESIAEAKENRTMALMEMDQVTKMSMFDDNGELDTQAVDQYYNIHYVDNSVPDTKDEYVAYFMDQFDLTEEEAIDSWNMEHPTEEDDQTYSELVEMLEQQALDNHKSNTDKPDLEVHYAPFAAYEKRERLREEALKNPQPEDKWSKFYREKWDEFVERKKNSEANSPKPQ